MAPRAKDEDPEEAMRRKFRAMCRFRMLGRLVIENLGWMIEETLPIVEVNAPKVSAYIQDLLIRKKLLTLEDKYLLTKDISWRTDDQKEYLYKILGGLKCFKMYPKNVRRYLCGICNFKYFGPGRMVARKDCVANAMYYIVSGEIEAIDKMYDAYTKTWNDGFAARLKPGSEFGQKELLHNEIRPYSYKTLTSVELIYITKENFDIALEITIQKQWQDLKEAMSQFTYFASFTKEAILQGCMAGMLKSYKTSETILGDDKGFKTYVYFILQGTCQFVDTLFVQEEKYIRKKIYKPYTLKELTPSVMELGTNLKNTELIKAESEGMLQSLKFSDHTRMSVSQKSIRSSITSSRKFDISEGKISSAFLIKVCNLPPDVKVNFMQVCLMNAGGCFGWEDKMELRRVLAINNVKCLLLPKQWLWQWNPSNIWHRVKHYYDMKIPSKKSIFDRFVIDRKWDDYKEELVNEINKNKKAVNWTRRQDVPYTVIIRECLNLREDYDF